MDSIWERMIFEERRKRAAELGVKVSELEEQDALNHTIDASRINTTDENHDKPVNNIKETDISYDFVPDKRMGSTKVLKSEAEEIDGDDYDDIDESVKDSSYQKAVTRCCLTAQNDKSTTKSSKTVGIGIEGGRWHTLPLELVDRILIVLSDIDTCGYLLMASRSTFTPSEKVFEHLCYVTYPRQTARRQLQVERWRSWRRMLIHRPRLRTNGFYTLRTMYSKAPCNDAFWEEKKVQSIEVKFYRHMRFFDYGRMLYSLDIAEPHIMGRLLKGGSTLPKRIFEGTYTIVKREVRIKVPLHYSVMWFKLRLLDGDDGYIGKHNMLTLVSHSSTSLNSPTSELSIENWTNKGEAHSELDRVYYPIPIVANLRFNRFWDFSSAVDFSNDVQA